MKTSDSDPIRIAEIELERCKIGLSFCPGKYQPNAMSGPWDRSLDKDLAAIREHGYEAVISLIYLDSRGRDEFELLKVTDLKDGIVERYGMEWLWIPIVDVQTPDGTPFEQRQRLNEILGFLNSGRSVFVHCKGGLGRAGLVTAWALTHFGRTPEDAIREVRRVRSGSIENLKQERWVKTNSGLKIMERDKGAKK